MITASDILSTKVTKQVCISHGKIIDMALDSSNKHLVVISYDKGNSNIFIYDQNLE